MGRNIMVDEEETNQASRNQWVLLVRRAFGIPDIVGIEAAMESIEAILREQNDLEKMDRPENPTIESAFIDAIIEAGHSNALDEVLLGLDGGEIAARDFVNRYVSENTSWSTGGIYSATESLTRFTIEKIRSFLNDHPFDLRSA
jgi:hypothetical protein